MKTGDEIKQNSVSMPHDAADAWAEVYIDVAEKIDHDEREPAGQANGRQKGTPAANDT